MILNGLWNFAITPAAQAAPAIYTRKIPVPFAVESNLSGIQSTEDDTQELWYNSTFTISGFWIVKWRSIFLSVTGGKGSA